MLYNQVNRNATIELFKTLEPCGYSVMVNTPTWLHEQASQVRYEFVEKAAGAKRQSQAVQIPLVNLVTTQSEEMEQKVLESVKRIASVIHCFQVAYSGFSFFDTGKSFKLNISNDETLVSLRDLLQGELQSYQLLSYSAAGFEVAGFDSEWTSTYGDYHEFTHASSTNDFRVSSLSILKKVAGQEGWQLLKEVPLGRA